VFGFSFLAPVFEKTHYVLLEYASRREKGLNGVGG